MSIRGHILIVDNVSSNLEALQPLVEGWGYRVFTANSSKAAKVILDRQHIDLAIIDVRLSDENDESDRSGIALAEYIDEYVDKKIAKILMTAFQKFELREKWIQRTNIYLKDHPIDELREKVDLPFEEYLRYNHNLKINYSSSVTKSKLIQPLHKEGSLAHWSDERSFLQSFERLLRKLFFRESRIKLKVLNIGHSGAGVVLVQRFYGNKKGSPVVVKYDLKSAINKEAKRYYDFVEPYLIMHSTHLIGRVESSHQLAGMKLMFIGASFKKHDPIYTFAKAFQSPNLFDNRNLENCIRHLFTKSCSLWYQGKQKWKKRSTYSVTNGIRDLPTYYESWLKLDSAEKQQRIRKTVYHLHNQHIQTIHIAVDKQTITFTRDAGEPNILPNPYYVWCNQREHLPQRSVYTCITHGDLHKRNFLVDLHEHTWLIDFQRTGIGPGLRDAAELESSIKFELLDSADLPSLLKFEDEALNCTHLNQRIATHTLPKMRAKQMRLFERAKITIDAIRHEASSALDHPPMDEYLTGLFFYAIKMLSFEHMTTKASTDVMQCHTLYSAARICQILLDGRRVG